MKITVYRNREVYRDNSKIGNDNENKVEILEFEFPEEFKEYTKYIEFQVKGQKYVDFIKDNKYEITREIAKRGKVKMQVVLKKNIDSDTAVFKSNIFEFNVSQSINATEEIIHNTNPDIIQKIVIDIEDLQKNKVDKAIGKDLSTNDFTNEYKNKLESLENYDDALLNTRMSNVENENTEQDTRIGNIEKEQISQNTNIENNRVKISNLELDNETNKQSILELQNSDNVLNDKIIVLQQENKQLKSQIPTRKQNWRKCNFK